MALVDDEDYESLRVFKWHAVRGYATFYAARWLPNTFPRKNIKMHSQILGTTKLIDHKDRDGLNNQKLNLELSNKHLNALNSDRIQNATGVHYEKSRNTYKAFLLRPKQYVGTYKTYEAAYKAVQFAKGGR